MLEIYDDNAFIDMRQVSYLEGYCFGYVQGLFRRIKALSKHNAEYKYVLSEKDRNLVDFYERYGMLSYKEIAEIVWSESEFWYSSDDVYNKRMR